MTVASSAKRRSSRDRPASRRRHARPQPGSRRRGRSPRPSAARRPRAPSPRRPRGAGTRSSPGSLQAELLGDHNQTQRLAGRAAAARSPWVGSGPLATCERQHASPFALPLSARAASSPNGRRPGAPRYRTPSCSATALQRRRLENGTSRKRRLRLRGEGVCDRLQGQIACRGTRSKLAEHRLHTLLGDGCGRQDLDDSQRRLGERPGLIDADRVHRGERLDRVELLREDPRGATFARPQRRR